MLLWTTSLLTVWPLKKLIPTLLKTESALLLVRLTPGLLLVTLLSSNVPTLLPLSKRLPSPLVSMLPTSNSTLRVFSPTVVPLSITVSCSLVTTLLMLTGRSRTLGVPSSVKMVTSNSLLLSLVPPLPTLVLSVPELMLLTFEKILNQLLKNI